ncbi:MAG TPA: sigma factor, partial [Gemmatimonadales bacterium]|nr:sigma factor [Gemmatimonadales bacterium]
AVGSADPETRDRGFNALVRVYWRPVYLHLRLRWHREREDAEDLTQEFFARAAEKGFFDGYDPDRARFRTFLRVCLDRFAANARRAERRLKRGGGRVVLSLDFAGLERGMTLSEPPDEFEPDRRFHREWLRALFSEAAQDLRLLTESGDRRIRFEVFARHDLETPADGERPSYRSLAREFGLPVTQVTNHLAWARREFRRLVLERLRQISGSEAEFRAEARELFGVDPG